MGFKDYRDLYAYDKALPLKAEERLIEDNPDYMLFKIYYDSVNKIRVPALLSIPKGGVKPCPCILFLHGYGGRKEDAVALMKIAARHGYSVISIDAEYHGERKIPGVELYSPDLEMSREGIIQTVIDLRRAVDYLESNENIDAGRIAYIGGSMGGIFGGILVGVEDRLKTAVLITAGGNISLMVRLSTHHTMPAIRRFIAETGISYEDFQKAVDPVDPINFIDKFSKPILFHLGLKDDVVPAEAGRQLAEKAKEPKKVYWYDAGHSLPSEIVAARTLNWLEYHLLGS